MALRQTTFKIKQMIDDLHEQFLTMEGPVNKKDFNFFHKVKEETSPMFNLNNQWLDEAEEFVKNRGVSVHPNQVKSTHENMEMLILHSYYLDVEKKRFKELHQSSHYVLDMILNDLNNV
ncbi:YppE family protein [Halobacillus amylolyticus]|uniref:YppE family protein n=1 Tax=Halobacillus amylolyticus TaxID=2932259 RepID=A0ABY4HD62_9BACI|nr:YppE family protein [Halobacillus amylolyticus]UOR12496.1 YppE family protein [Halobacillus amylolyticus]